MGHGPESLVIGFVIGSGQDGRSFRHAGPQAAEMVEMMMSIHGISYRFVGNRFFDGIDHGDGTVVVQRAFDQHNIILELYGHTVMRAAGQVPHTVGHFLRGDFDGRRRSLLDIVRHRKDDVGIIRVCLGDGQVEKWETALFLDNVRREGDIRSDLA